MLVVDTQYPKVYICPTWPELPKDTSQVCSRSYVVSAPGAHPVALDGQRVQRLSSHYRSIRFFEESALLAAGYHLCSDYDAEVDKLREPRA